MCVFWVLVQDTSKSRFVPASLRPHPRSVRPSVRPGAFQRLDSIGKSTPTLTGDVFVLTEATNVAEQRRTCLDVAGFLPVWPRFMGCRHATRWSILSQPFVTEVFQKFVDLISIISDFEVLSGN